MTAPAPIKLHILLSQYSIADAPEIAKRPLDRIINSAAMVSEESVKGYLDQGWMSLGSGLFYPELIPASAVAQTAIEALQQSIKHKKQETYEFITATEETIKNLLCLTYEAPEPVVVYDIPGESDEGTDFTAAQ